ncbi:Aspartokinase II/homoserine dehydrogenase II [Raoultella terrigena]|uniref:Aspartokinase II/homoserine dehydrogenase II n=1 Tax=Raoultella terrigena TaxID=577 RepID=A0A4U9D532_RAOTE|nr:Aspartokinase II/homoserine dehydrogenase II [Raoultella terrigena]
MKPCARSIRWRRCYRCDNVFAIDSRWYRDNPLVIRGPGAGRDVTAGAIQSDINRLAQLL